MNNTYLLYGLLSAALVYLAPRIHRRLQLSRAKHRSLAGHGRISRRLARWVSGYDYDEADIFRSDGAPEQIEARRRAGFERLARQLAQNAPQSITCTRGIGAVCL